MEDAPRRADWQLILTWVRKNSSNHLVREAAERLEVSGLAYRQRFYEIADRFRDLRQQLAQERALCDRLANALETVRTTRTRGPAALAAWNNAVEVQREYEAHRSTQEPT